MDIQTLTEISYKNGYKKGIEDFVKELHKEYDQYSSIDDTTIGHLLNFIDKLKEEALKKYE